MKTCFKCQKKKPLTSFYQHKMMKDGHLNKCKTCTKLDVKRRYYSPEGFLKVREYESKRSKLPHRLALSSKTTKEWRAKRKGAYRAHTKVGNALRDGKIKKKNCEACGSQNSHAHHSDYRKPLSVQWLCPLHHARVHHNNGHLHPIQ